jgi:hypothetical protein
MNLKLLGYLSLLSLVVTAIWLVLFITGMAGAPPLETWEEAVSAARSIDGLFYLTYLNAVLVTLFALALFGGLYAYLRSVSPLWAAIGLVFVPVYGLLNLVVYFSQITLLPRLLPFLDNPRHAPTMEILISQFFQQWTGSTLNVFNNLGYAILGIPSIIFGMLLVNAIFHAMLRIAGVLLVTSGIASLLGIVGILAGSELLGWGSVLGGALYLLALIPLAAGFLRNDLPQLTASQISNSI